MAVIRIGRNRERAESAAASRAVAPSSMRWLAMSTIRMPFLAAKPISITSPTWAKMLSTSPRAARNSSAPSMAVGTVIKMIKGSV